MTQRIVWRRLGQEELGLPVATERRCFRRGTNREVEKGAVLAEGQLVHRQVARPFSTAHQQDRALHPSGELLTTSAEGGRIEHAARVSWMAARRDYPKPSRCPAARC